MKFTESKPKSLIYTILIYVFCLFEMGVLSSYRFVVLGSSLDKCMGMSMSKVNNLAQVGSNVGWNFITWSVLLILGIWGFCMLMGYNRNPGGLIAVAVMNVVPLIGLAANFNFWIGYGYSIYSPAMALFGLTFCKTHNQQIVNNVVFAAIVLVVSVVCWFIGYKIRAAYAKKYEYDD
jgi:hypothetical protein